MPARRQVRCVRETELGTAVTIRYHRLKTSLKYFKMDFLMIYTFIIIIIIYL